MAIKYKIDDLVVLCTHDGDTNHDRQSWSQVQGLNVNGLYTIGNTQDTEDGLKLRIRYNDMYLWHLASKFKLYNPVKRNIPWL